MCRTGVYILRLFAHGCGGINSEIHDVWGSNYVYTRRKIETYEEEAFLKNFQGKTEAERYYFVTPMYIILISVIVSSHIGFIVNNFFL